MEPKVTINAKGDSVTIRTGEAAPERIAGKLTIVGDIKAPAEFNKKRKEIIIKTESAVQYCYKARYIRLQVNDRHADEISVEGRLDFSHELAKFNIYIGNGDAKMYDQTSLVKLIRFNKACFAKLDEADKIVNALAKLRVKIDRDIESAKDERGNKKSLDEMKVTSDVPLNFTIKCPVFKGYEEKSFLVDICFEVRDRGLNFWLESTELAEIIERESKALMDVQLAALSEYACIQN